MGLGSGTVRRPAVAGRFYPADARKLDAEVAGYLTGGTALGGSARQALGVVAPHAGYVYSGGVAGKVFAAVEVPRRVVVLAPNHTGLGTRVAVAATGGFEIPGAVLPIDEPLAAAILDEMPGAKADTRAHLHEHAVEVELPFLHARRPDVTIVPIVLASLGEEEAVAVGEGLARALRAAGDEHVLVVASSDMSHYLPDDVTRRQDRLAIDQMLRLDPRGLYQTVESHDISMCGYLPATAMLACSLARGAGRAELVGYATSGEAFGDYDRVVGYAGVVVS
jgi:hypothetical protein